MSFIDTEECDFLNPRKAPTSEYPFEVKDLTEPKHYWNVSRRCFYSNFPLMYD